MRHVAGYGSGPIAGYRQIFGKARKLRLEINDWAVRFLIVDPDPETGKLGPVLSGGMPRIIHLGGEAGLSWRVARRVVASDE
jgi:hypothetical protein